jgi:hypothetical protein
MCDLVLYKKKGNMVYLKVHHVNEAASCITNVSLVLPKHKQNIIDDNFLHNAILKYRYFF